MHGLPSLQIYLLGNKESLPLHLVCANFPSKYLLAQSLPYYNAHTTLGCTRLFQPHKPVTKGQAAIALSSGEASDIVSEELARIEAESMAEKAVSAHNALVAEVEKDVNASFEKELSMEREKIEAVEKMAELAKVELEQLREKREEENLALVKERAAVESEMEVLSRLRRDAEEKLEDLMSNKAEITFEKERVFNLRKEAEEESQRISKLQYELEVERKALSMARYFFYSSSYIMFIMQIIYLHSDF